MESRVYEVAKKELYNLEKQIGIIKRRLKTSPPGYLKISYCRGNVQYYHVLNGDQECTHRIKESTSEKDNNDYTIKESTSEKDNNDYTNKEPTSEKRIKYIRKKDHAIVPALAQKTFDLRILKVLEERRKALKYLIQTYSATDPFAIADSLCDARTKLINSQYMSDEQYAELWQARQYFHKSFAANSPEIYTVKGERVRSKSEKIIADALERSGIPYHYEFPVELDSGILIHPDFCVLNKRNRRVYYWEHLGLLDNPEYCNNAIKKLEEMAENGILPGENLIITAETAQHVISNKIINNTINTYLL